LKSIYLRWCKLEETLTGIGFISLIGLVFLSAILRFLRISVSWNIDLAMLMLAWTSFLGADIAWRNNQIIGVDLFTRPLPKKVKQSIELIVYLIIGIGLVLISIYGLRLAWSERLARFQSMQIPYSLVTSSLIIASTSMMLTTLGKIKKQISILRFPNTQQVSTSTQRVKK
jgi:TRAP-type C4-dicarboxylate transport system permease small subunit